MKRRSLFWLPMLAFPARLFGQDSPRRSSTKTAKARRVADEDDGAAAPPRRKGEANPEADAVDNGAGAAGSEAAPANFPTPAGFQWQTFPIGDYTALAPGASSPQTAIIDWIFRLTSSAPWHGDRPAALCASKTQLKACNTPKILKQVAQVVEKFTDAERNILDVRVRFLAAGDPRWRHAIYSRLTPIGNGPQGQQVWHASAADAESVILQMQAWSGFRSLGEKSRATLNGQNLKFTRAESQAVTAEVQRDGAVGLGYQPKVSQLEEGVVLRFSPLLSYEGDTLDAAIELTTNVVRKLHPVKVLAPREVGPSELTIDVPEVSETRLNQTIKGWPIGQALILSAGIQPGILMDKGGLFNMKIPGTVPTGTELVVVINVEFAKEKQGK